MPLIKIFPAFSEDTERNIQADLVGEIFGLNIYFRNSNQGKDFYLEVPMSGGSLFERMDSVYTNPFDINQEVELVKKKISAFYTDAQFVKDRQFALYTKLWSDMANAAVDDLPLPQNRHSLVSYTKYKIIFGDNASPESAFYAVLKSLKDKQLAINQKIKQEKDHEEANKRALLEAAREDAIVELKQKVIGNLAINGRELVELSRLVGVGIPIRTQGMFMEQIDEVNSDRCLGRFRKGVKVKVHPSTYYKEIKASLLKPVEEDNQLAEQLFKTGGTNIN